MKCKYMIKFYKKKLVVTDATNVPSSLMIFQEYYVHNVGQMIPIDFNQCLVIVSLGILKIQVINAKLVETTMIYAVNVTQLNVRIAI